MNLLTQRLIFASFTGREPGSLTLPETLAALIRDRIDAFPMARRHQRYPLKMFLVQLAALACQNSGVAVPPDDPAEWLRLLRALTPEWSDDAPWLLVNQKMTEPAFLQPPVATPDAESDYRMEVATTDDLEITVQSRQFEARARTDHPQPPDAWVFTLISLQTHGGYMGSGNYGIARMNGGLGSRPHIGLTPSLRIGAQVGRDASALLGSSDWDGDGHRLLWALPWSGQRDEALSPGSVHPLAIEVCRRIRLTQNSDGNISGKRANSRWTRIDIQQAPEAIRDPWAPKLREKNLPLTVGSRGFTSSIISGALARPDTWTPPALARPTKAEANSGRGLYLIASGLARGRGKTERYHETIHALAPETIHALADPEKTRSLGRILEERSGQAANLVRIVRMSLAAHLARSTSGASQGSGPRTARTAGELADAIESDFLSEAQREFRQKGENAGASVRDTWLRHLIARAWEVLNRAMDSGGAPSHSSDSARTSAVSMMEGTLRSEVGFPHLYASEREPGSRKAVRRRGRADDPLAPWVRTAMAAQEMITSPAFGGDDLRKLRQLDPMRADCPAFLRLLGHLEESVPDITCEKDSVQTLTLLVSGISLMTYSSASGHDPRMSLGRALYRGGAPDDRRVPHWSEHRMNALLASPTLETFGRELMSALRSLGEAGAGADLREIARVAAARTMDSRLYEELRRKVASDYHRAQRYAESLKHP